MCNVDGDDLMIFELVLIGKLLLEFCFEVLNIFG